MVSAKQQSYAELIRKAMRAKNMNRRDLEHATGFSYEHIRKIVSGLPLMSEKFNEDVCKVLDLNAEQMWEVATREKMKKHYGAGMLSAPPSDSRFRDIWGDLHAADIDRLFAIANGMAEQRRAERVMQDTDDPEKMRKMFEALMQKLHGKTEHPNDVPKRSAGR